MNKIRVASKIERNAIKFQVSRLIRIDYETKEKIYDLFEGKLSQTNDFIFVYSKKGKEEDLLKDDEKVLKKEALIKVLETFYESRNSFAS